MIKRQMPTTVSIVTSSGVHIYFKIITFVEFSSDIKQISNSFPLKHESDSNQCPSYIAIFLSLISGFHGQKFKI